MSIKFCDFFRTRKRGEKVTLRKNIQERAKKIGVPIYKIEEEIGLARGSISKWGDINPGIDKVKAFAEYMGCSIDDLVSEEKKTG